MNATLMKTVTLVFWVLVIIAWVQEWGGLLGYLPMAGVAVAAIHVLEVLLFVTVLSKRSRNVPMDALLIMIFGVFHLQRFMPSR